jgi:ABC-type ATPase with predicted acetyltransferase domain
MLHPGNQAYRSLIQKHETDYLWAKRSDKPVIAMQIMETLKRQDVRFVRKEGNSRGWLVLDENKIYEKVCQSLREGAPELRRKILASDARKKVGQSKSWAGSLDVDQENNAPILYI